MNYYDDEDNVRSYISMSEGYDGSMLIDRLKNHLPKGATLLELGMGPGHFELIELRRYAEFEEGDSIYLLMRKID